MTLWRISNRATLDGQGGLFASARWHTRGRRVVYLAESAAGALLEVLVHLEIDETVLPDTFQLLKAVVADAGSLVRLEEAILSERWPDDPGGTRQVGDRWLRQAGSVLLRVPSAIVPETYNWLLNPVHADAQHIQIEWSRRFPYDGRLLRTLKGP